MKKNLKQTARREGSILDGGKEQKNGKNIGVGWGLLTILSFQY